MDTPNAKLSTCPKCGTLFTCNPAGKCWCGEISLSQEMLDDLGKTYKGCLCPDCLKTFRVTAKEIPTKKT
jgi:hypothetical protein